MLHLKGNILFMRFYKIFSRKSCNYFSFIDFSVYMLGQIILIMKTFSRSLHWNLTSMFIFLLSLSHNVWQSLICCINMGHRLAWKFCGTRQVVEKNHSEKDHQNCQGLAVFLSDYKTAILWQFVSKRRSGDKPCSIYFFRYTLTLEAWTNEQVCDWN